MSDPLPLVIANLKANKTWDEVSAWLDKVGPVATNFGGTVIFCPSHPFLASSDFKLQSSKLRLGAQDVSPFEQGAYTGEVAASQIASLCQYAIIGHSERRQNFNETDEELNQKVQNSKNAKIEPIFCIQSEENQIPNGVEIIAYEPTFAIGTGNPDTPQNAKDIARKIKEKGSYTVLYGGSVSGENVKSYISKDLIDGVLVGATNSLDPEKFIAILNAANY
jgi:triosephosphate isomerase